MAVPHIFAGTAGGTTAQLDANFAYFSDAISAVGGDVGIGIASPIVKLHVEDQGVSVRTSYFTSGGSDVNFRLGFANGAGSAIETEQGQLVFDYVGTGAVASIGFHRGSAANAKAMTFNLNGSEYLRLDDAGNTILSAQASPPTLSVNRQMVMSLTSNTNLRISVRGTDGTTRVANITLA